MWEFVGQYKEAIGGFLVSVGGIAAVVWGAIQKARTTAAKTGADVAIAQSQGEVFSQMNERLKALDDRVKLQEIRIDDLLEQVRSRDNQIALLRLHVQALEHTLKLNGIPVPDTPLN